MVVEKMGFLADAVVDNLARMRDARDRAQAQATREKLVNQVQVGEARPPPPPGEPGASVSIYA